MVGQAYFRGRALFVLFMVFAITGAQFSALALENDHHHDSTHCCALCHVGLPFLQPAVSAAVPPVLSVVWLASLPEQVSTHQVLPALASSRAPPA